MNHTWNFLPKASKLHVLNAGNYTYEFEFPLPGDIPESTHVASFYLVQYRLKAVVERSRFMPNLTVRRIVHVARQMLPLTAEYMEPVTIANQWNDKLDYEITVPTKVYSHGDQIPVSIHVTPLVSHLRIRYFTCTLKEYMVCRASCGWFGGHARTHGRIIHFGRDDQFGQSNDSSDGSFIVWSKTQVVPVPPSPDQIQCDVQNEAVRIRHKLKFVLSVEHPDGKVSELRAALPIHICAVHDAGLPAYEETARSLPYDPALMIALLHSQTGEQIQNNRSSWFLNGVEEATLPSYSSIVAEGCNNSADQAPSRAPLNRLPTYDELLYA